MELFKCKKCDAKYPREYFHRCSSKPKGIHDICKFCSSEHAKLYRKRKAEERKDVNHIKFTSAGLKDYCAMYQLMEKLGYDIHSDKSIHEQFCLKYGLKPKKRDEHSKNRFEVKDCQKKTPTNNRRGLNE